jgi:hypothetical protein
MREIICTNLIKKRKKSNIYLGYWALKDSEILSYKNKNVIDFIWNNKNLFLRDSIIIKRIVLKLYHKLYISLNKTHNTKYSKKFWKILIFPWIYYYVSALYFRWQCIIKIKKKNNIFIFVKNLKFEKYNYENNIDILIDDNWNQKIFQEIVLYQKKNYTFQKVSQNYKNKEKKNILILLFSLIPNSLIAQIDYLISLLKKREVLFIHTSYTFKTSILFFLKKTYFNHFHKFFFTKINTLLIQSGKSQINLISKFNFVFKKIYQPKIQFEKFLLQRIIEDIPNSLLEDFNNYLNRFIKLRDAKKIITSYSLFEQSSNKFYIANQVNKGSIFYLLEHGGSLASKEEMLNLDISVVDKKITWFKPLIKKHFQIPTHPYYYLNIKNENSIKKNKKIIVIGPGDYKYIWNCSFNLKSPGLFDLIENLKNFYNIINVDIKKNVFIKPHPAFSADNSYNLNQFYKKIFNENIIKESSLINCIKSARIVVCTYPETTFALSMYSCVPTVVIYNKDHYIFHNKTNKLIKKLIKNKIIFNDSKQAAKHINKIWDNPEAWYNSLEVKKVRNLFLKTALGVAFPRDIEQEKKNWNMILN